MSSARQRQGALSRYAGEMASNSRHAQMSLTDAQTKALMMASRFSPHIWAPFNLTTQMGQSMDPFINHQVEYESWVDVEEEEEEQEARDGEDEAFGEATPAPAVLH
ncbi:hypothetical protein SDJN03_13656, partial [Cucurbita argyrosperma subsp. sororia]